MPEPNAQRVPRRIASIIINSLKGGVVPRIGLPYITVGRAREIEAFLHDLGLVADGGASFRFIVGRYGSGKSFLLQTIRNHAVGQGFVVCDADLSPERRLQGTHGQGLATYRELIRNLATKTQPEGGALNLILDRWISQIQSALVTEDGIAPDDPAFSQAVETRIHATVNRLEDLVHGYDFSQLLTRYWRAHLSGDDETKSHVIKWFRGEYRTKTEARQELGVSIIIDDESWYDYLKLFAEFFRGAGYKGLIVEIDELVNLYKIPNAISRQYNYEKILAMYNDTLQGKAHHLGIIMSGTPQSIEDRRRGLYSYEALRSRLTQGRFAREGMADMLAPVIHLDPLTPEELLVLTEKLADIHAGFFGYTRSMDEDGLARFLQAEYRCEGASSHLTPRELIRDFIEMLDILLQNPQLTLDGLLGSDALKEPVKTPVELAEEAHTAACAPRSASRHGAHAPLVGADASGAVPGTDPTRAASISPAAGSTRVAAPPRVSRDAELASFEL